MTAFILCWASLLVPACAPMDGHCAVQLISQVSSIAPGQPFWVGVRFQMDPGWHIYWTNPGDSGLPTTVKWTLPNGFTAGTLKWPAPKRIEDAGIVNYGFDGQVVALVEITPPRGLAPGAKVVLNAKADWLVCQEQCVPGSKELRLQLGSSAKAVDDPAGVAAIASANRMLPRAKAPNAACSAEPDGVLKLSFSLDGLLAESRESEFGHDVQVVFFADKAGVVEPDQPQTLEFEGPNGKKDTLILRVKRSPGLLKIPDTLEGVLAVQYSQNKTVAWIVRAPIEK